MKYPKTISVNTKDLVILLHFARRYCDGRYTFSPITFNNIYDAIADKYAFIKEMDKEDKALMHFGAYFPYAQDGGYDPETKRFDARHVVYDDTGLDFSEKK